MARLTQTKQILTKTQEKQDIITILKFLIKFKSRNGGSNPSRCNMDPFFVSLKTKLHQDFDYNQLCKKFIALKYRYIKSLTKGVGPTALDREIFDLSVQAWGAEPKSEPGRMFKRMMELEGREFDCLKDEIGKYWEEEGLVKRELEAGLRKMDKNKAWKLEKRWRAFLEEEIIVGAERCAVMGEICEKLLGLVADNSDSDSDSATSDCDK